MRDFQVTSQNHGHLLTFTILQPLNSDDIFQYFHVSRHLRYRYYQQKCVALNHQTIVKNMPLPPHSRLSITGLCEPMEPLVPCWRECSVHYEDDLCLVVNKPPQMLVHPDGVHQQDTLHNCVQAYYDTHHIQAPIRAIHRLDYETSGLVFYNKLPFFQGYFDDQLKQKKIDRIYLAWVTGLINAPLRIAKPIGRDRHDAKKMRVSPTGKPAYTEVIPLIHKGNATLVKCVLKTGRTHQIRVHLADAHHPLLSDPLYGKRDPGMERCALHAWQLRFIHPLSEEKITVTAAPPADMHIPAAMLSSL